MVIRRALFQTTLLVGCVVAGTTGVITAVHDLGLLVDRTGPTVAICYSLGLIAGAVVALAGMVLRRTRVGAHLEGAGITAAGLSVAIYIGHLSTADPPPVIALVLLGALALGCLLRAVAIGLALRQHRRTHGRLG